MNGDDGFEPLVDFLRKARGFDFTAYKRPSLTRRIDKRMEEVGVGDYRAYRDLIEADANEFELLFDTILINVTGFFRDPATWKALEDRITGPLVGGTGDVRVWSAGCSSGEEAYTIAMILARAIGPSFSERLKIFATDVDDDALAEGRRARYDARRVADIPDGYRHFVEERDGAFFIRQDLRRTVIFGHHNVISDPPISNLDLVVCRNTLMYLNSEAQRSALRRLHFGLRPDGFLILGRAEMLLARDMDFSTIDIANRLFQKTGSSGRGTMIEPGTASSDDAVPDVIRLREAAFEMSPIALMVVTADGRLTAANAAARTMFRLRAADIGRMFSDLDVAYRPLDLGPAIAEAFASQRPYRMQIVERKIGKDERQYLEVEVAPLNQDGRIGGASIAIQDVSETHGIRLRLAATTDELTSVNEELHHANEELETTNEELQSTNEELETTNEELQSTNEELETTNEELQSTNEELQTLNDDLRQRSLDSQDASMLVHSILRHLDVAAIVVDNDLRVVAWTEGATRRWGLSEAEAIGKPLFALKFSLPATELHEAIRNSLEGDPASRQVIRMPDGESVAVTTARYGAGTAPVGVLIIEFSPQAATATS